MPSGQILYLMMFVGNLACTSHVLQYSSSRSYEHSRSLQSSLCPGVVTVLICWASLHVFSPRQSWCEHPFVRMAWRKRSFFVEALLNLHKFEKRRQNYTYFHKPPNFFVSFLHFLPIFTFFRFAISRILCNFAPESIKSSSLLRLTRQPSFGNHGGQYDAEAILFTSKNSKLCNSTFITSSLLCVS